MNIPYPGPEVISARQQRCPGGGRCSCTLIEPCEPGAFLRNTVYVWSFNLGIAFKRDVAITKIINKKQYNIRFEIFRNTGLMVLPAARNLGR